MVCCTRHLADKVAISLLLNQLDQRHCPVGHRHLRSWFKVSQPEPARRLTMATSVKPGHGLR
jgi:hypothetical protein